MRGQVVIACNCDYGCPCNVNGRPTMGKCEGGWTWAIEKGAYGEVPLDGMTIGQYANWPAAIHEGNGVAVSFIDERADKPQRQALRSEEHTSELQSQFHLVCRLLLEKKK